MTAESPDVVASSPGKTASLYDSYSELKQYTWDSRSRYPQFDGWLSPYVPPGCSVLEFGFGDGQLLRWARDRGCSVNGVDRIPELVSMARKNGFAAYSLLSEVSDKVDVILAMDVLEHLDISEVSTFFKEAKRLLKADGLVIAKFPNGASPFSLYIQSGDATHLKPLSPTSVQQIAAPVGFRPKATFNPRHLPTSLIGKAKARLAFFVRDVVETAIGYAYVGGRVPLDPNIVVVMQSV